MFECESSINYSYVFFLCSQGPVEDRCDSSWPSEENPQQHPVHAPADVSVPDRHSAGMTTGGAGRWAGQLADELPAGEPNPIGARQNRDYHPDLRPCIRRGTVIPYPTDQIRTGPPGLTGCLLTRQPFVSSGYTYRENRMEADSFCPLLIMNYLYDAYPEITVTDQIPRRLASFSTRFFRSSFFPL